MAAELAQIKDVFMDNLRAVMERGEKLDDLCKKTENLETTTYKYKKKAKKMNSWWSRWGWMCPAACGGPKDESRGADAPPLPGKLATAKAAADIAQAAKDF